MHSTHHISAVRGFMRSRSSFTTCTRSQNVNRQFTLVRGRRYYSEQPHQSNEPPHPKKRSAYAQWYAEIVPGMIPVALLGSAVYLGLHLGQVYLSNEKYLDEANARIAALEREIDELRAERDRKKKGPPIVDKGPSRWWFAGL